MLKRREIAFIVAIVTGIVRGSSDKKSYCRDAYWINAGNNCIYADGKSRKFKKII